MARIIRANESGEIPRLRRESLEVAAAPGQALAASARRQANVARNEEAEAKAEARRAVALAANHARFKELSRKSSINAAVNNAFNIASEKFAEESRKRYEQVLDQDGNPTFETLPDDIKSIGDSVASNVAAFNLTSGEAKTAFTQAFSSFMADQMGRAYQTSRAQQVDFTKTATLGAVSKLTDLATADDFSSFPSYARQVKNILTGAVSDGSLSSQEAAKIQESFRSQASINSVNNSIYADPERTALMLQSGSPEDFGLTNQEYISASQQAQQQVTRVREARLKDQETKEQAELRSAEQDRQRQSNLFSSEISRRISEARSDPAATLEQLKSMQEDIVQAGSFLTEEEANKEATKVQNAINSATQDISVISEIDSAISDGGTLLSQYTGGELDKWYRSKLQPVVSSPDLTGIDKITIIGNTLKQVPANIGAGQDDLASFLNFGEAEERIAAAQMIDTLRQTNPRTVAQISQEDSLLAERLVRSQFIAGLDPVRAVERAEEIGRKGSLIDKDRLMREGESIAKDINLTDIVDKTGLEVSDFIPFAETAQGDYVESIMRTMFVDNYMVHGDKDSALALTYKQAASLIGSSDLTKAMERDPDRFSEMINLVDVTTGTAMLMPPEKAVNASGIPTKNQRELLRASLAEAVEGHLPEGSDLDDVTYQYVPRGEEMLPSSYPPGTRLYKLNVRDATGAIFELPVFWAVSEADIVKRGLERARTLQSGTPAAGLAEMLTSPSTVVPSRGNQAPSLFDMVTGDSDE